ncbi:MAG: hypothetical protein ABFD64_04980 [Armatimonadota bacterium]
MSPERRRNLVIALAIFAVYCIIEIASLLFGFGLLSRGATFMPGIASGMFVGYAMIEGLLTFKPGESVFIAQPDDDIKLHRMPIVKAMLYVFAPMAALPVRINHWLIYLSIALFAGILVHVGWLVAKYVREPNNA